MNIRCKDGNHTVGCGYDTSAVGMAWYIEENRKHPGMLFRYCPDCGTRLQFLDDLADEYEKQQAKEDKAND